jgi:hypoxanthine phosphoribosyltransferase
VTGAGSRDPEILLDEQALGDRVERLAVAIARDHPDGILLVGVLKGALIFLADLVRRLQGVEVSIDFLAISRYAPDSGRVRLLKDLDLDVTGRDVILVEDLVDTGLTLAYLVEHVVARGARTVDVCTLLDRADRRIVPLPLRYVGEVLAGDTYVLGYGLHHRERYRNLRVVVRADPAALAADPDVYLGLYEPRDQKGVNEARC